MLYILINDVNLKVRCGKTTGEKINTNIGVPQGDCLSPVLFTLYLAAALETKRNREDHNYSKPSSCSTVANHRYPHLEEHSYNRTKDTILIDQQYADDIGWAANNVQNISSLEANITARIQKYNQQRKDRTILYKKKWRRPLEKVQISWQPLEQNRRHKKKKTTGKCSIQQAIIYTRRPEDYSQNQDQNTRSIFLYNSELWTVTQDMEDQIDVLQISSSEERLPRLTRRTLAQLRTNKSPFLKSYLHKVDAKTHPSPLCPLCNINTHDTHHLFNCTHIRTTLSPLDLWTDPAGVTALLARWTEKLAGGPHAGTSDSPH